MNELRHPHLLNQLDLNKKSQVSFVNKHHELTDHMLFVKKLNKYYKNTMFPCCCHTC